MNTNKECKISYKGRKYLLTIYLPTVESLYVGIYELTKHNKIKVFDYSGNSTLSDSDDEYYINLFKKAFTTYIDNVQILKERK